MSKCFLVAPQINIGVVYVHVPNCPQHAAWGYHFVQTNLAHHPGIEHELIVACNGGEPTGPMKEIFKQLGPVTYFYHDDSGWDIGAFQAFAKQSKHDMLVFLGGSAYSRRAGWLLRMAESWLGAGGEALFGACGNLGDKRSNVFPHIRTTGFWCAPMILNEYPVIVRDPSMRYPFEHGQQSLTQWARMNSIPVLVSDFSGVYEYPYWNDGANGYHRGDQRDLVIGDRLTAPPYYHAP